MYFIITGIQFWISDYMQLVLGTPKSVVFICFSIVSITAPTFGVITGGYMVTYFGGYEKEESFLACRKLAIIALIVALPIPLISKLEVFLLLVWLLLFFGACIVPGLTGRMLATLNSSQKETGNSFTIFCYNIFGYLPSPFIYGTICELTGGEKSVWGLSFLMSVSFIGVGCLFLVDSKAVNSREVSLIDLQIDFNTTPTRGRASSGYLSSIYGVNINT